MVLSQFEKKLDERSKNPRFKGPLDVVRQTIAEKGFFGLYRGLPPLLYGSIPKSAVRFGAYEFFRSRLVDENGKLSQQRTLLAGLGAGVSEAIFAVCPMEVLFLFLCYFVGGISILFSFFRLSKSSSSTIRINRSRSFVDLPMEFLASFVRKGLGVFTRGCCQPF